MCLEAYFDTTIWTLTTSKGTMIPVRRDGITSWSSPKFSSARTIYNNTSVYIVFGVHMFWCLKYPQYIEHLDK